MVVVCIWLVEYINSKKVADSWGISERRVRLLCANGKIEGAVKHGKTWLIPIDAIKPTDGRSYRHLEINKTYESLLRKIDSKRDALRKLRPLTQGEKEKIEKDFLIEYTYDSNAIEGSTLTLQETALVLDGITIDQKPLSEHLDAIGHKEAYLYIEKLVKDNIPISERIIKEIHSLVLANRPEDRGVFRRICVKIMGTDFETSDPLNIRDDIEKLLNLYKKMTDKHIVEKIAYFHRRFERIHPFIDGNGRSGRLLLNMELLKHGYPAINIKYRDRKKYYDAFESLEKMTELLACYLDEQLTKLTSLIS